MFLQHDECDDICVICQDDLRAAPGGSTRGGTRGMSPVMKVRMLDCGHMFHDEVRVIGFSSSCVEVRARSCVTPEYTPYSFRIKIRVRDKD